MSDVRLSFCIPTYNFGEFIGQTLESIIAQAGDDVEIIVGDGASTDNTEEIVKGYQLSFPRLFYYKFEKKGGIDLDLSRTVDLSTGEYCWLMSSDDCLNPGAIQRMLNEIKFGHDVYLCNRTCCDRNLNPIVNQLWLSNEVADQTFHFSNESELMDYLHAATSIGALFSYVSSIIVRRNKWDEIGYNKKLSGSNYAHVFRLFYILQTGKSTLKYLKESLVLCRGDNDSFLDKGIANRLSIDFDGYQLLSESLFAKKTIRNTFKTVVEREHNWRRLVIVKSQVDNRQWADLKKSLQNYSYRYRCLINIFGHSKFLFRMSYLYERARSVIKKKFGQFSIF